MQGDDLNIPPGQMLNPFGGAFKGKWNAAASAAEALYNAQIDSQGAMDLVPGQALNLEINPVDAGAINGPVADAPRILAKISGETAAGVYSGNQAVDTGGGTYATQTGGFTFTGDLYCRQKIAGIPTGSVVEAWWETDQDGVGRWVFDAIGWVVPVDVSGSGSDGVWQVSEPGYVYTITDKHGNSLNAVAQSPMNQRMKAPYKVADEGWAYLGNGGTWLLGLVNEEAVIPPGATGDNLGYWELEDYSGNTASEINGKILITTISAPTRTGTQIPIDAVVSEGVGTDTVTLSVWSDDIPGIADGQGYEIVTAGAVSVAVTDGGEIEFETTSPGDLGADELPVVFTVTDNDPTATVTAVVDVSGLGGGSGGITGTIDMEVKVPTGITDSSTHGPYTLDGAVDFRGRAFSATVLGARDATAADWGDAATTMFASLSGGYFGTSPPGSLLFTYDPGSGDIDVYGLVIYDAPTPSTSFTVFIDAADGKLKMWVGGAPATDSHYCRIFMPYGAAKTTPDLTLS